MKKILNLVTLSLSLSALMFSTNFANAQCATWIGNPKEGPATDAHTIYRGMVKEEKFDEAYEQWKIAYDIAPAADGKRDFHFTDGIKIFKHKFKNETDATKKQEYSDMVIKLYDDAMACFEGGSIVMKNMDPKERIGYLSGRKAFDMFYELVTPYSQTLPALQGAVEKAGNNVEYIVLDPYAHVVVNLFSNKKMDKVEARGIYLQLNEIVDHNIANNEKYKTQFEATKKSMNATFAQIDAHIFDCDYWKNKLKPKYDAAPNDKEVVKEVYLKLRAQGCDDADPMLAEMEVKYKKMVGDINKQKLAEYEANNPGVLASKAYKAGDYPGAIAKYEEAISMETDDFKKSEYYMGLASIEGRKLGNLSKGREHARKAAKLNPNSGKPYMLIGDFYAKGARKCGDAFMQRCAILAAIDKYSYAKSVDPSLTEDANSRIGKYSGSRPDKETAFMKGYKSGQSIKVGCWIGETVKLRF